MFKPVGKAKVGDDDVPVAIEEKVLEFEITVDYFLLVDVPDTRDELRKEFCSVFFFEVAMGQDVIKELATRGVLEDDANVFVCLYDVVETNNVGVFERLKTMRRGEEGRGRRGR